MDAGEAGARLHHAIVGEYRIPAVPGRLSVEQGHELRREIAQRFVASGDRIAGHKVGLTTPTSQRAFAAHAPGRGYLFASQILRNGAGIPSGDLDYLVEVELAIVLAEDIPADASLTDEYLLGAIGWCCTAIEVVASRWVGGPAGSMGAWTADNGMAALTILGDTRISYGRAGEPLRASLRVDNRVHDVRAAPPVLSNLRWLVEDLRADGLVLPRRAIVLTGALLDAVEVPATGAYVEAAIDGYGTANAVFAPSGR